MSESGDVFKPQPILWLCDNICEHVETAPLGDGVVLKPPVEGDENASPMPKLKVVIVENPLEFDFHPYPCPVCNAAVARKRPEYDRQQTKKEPPG